MLLQLRIVKIHLWVILVVGTLLSGCSSGSSSGVAVSPSTPVATPAPAATSAPPPSVGSNPTPTPQAPSDSFDPTPGTSPPSPIPSVPTPTPTAVPPLTPVPGASPIPSVSPSPSVGPSPSVSPSPSVGPSPSPDPVSTVITFNQTVSTFAGFIQISVQRPPSDFPPVEDELFQPSFSVDGVVFVRSSLEIYPGFSTFSADVQTGLAEVVFDQLQIPGVTNADCVIVHDTPLDPLVPANQLAVSTGC